MILGPLTGLSSVLNRYWKKRSVVTPKYSGRGEEFRTQVHQEKTDDVEQERHLQCVRAVQLQMQRSWAGKTTLLVVFTLKPSRCITMGAYITHGSTFDFLSCENNTVPLQQIPLPTPGICAIQVCLHRGDWEVGGAVPKSLCTRCLVTKPTNL